MGAHVFMGSLHKHDEPIHLNSTTLTLCTILKCVAASAAEAELGALFLNAQGATIMALTLVELGHPQPAISIHADNTTAVVIVNNTVKRQRSRAMEMRYFWLLDQAVQRRFSVQYHPGQENLGDYQTKHHLGYHHVKGRPFYLHSHNSPYFFHVQRDKVHVEGVLESLGIPT